MCSSDLEGQTRDVVPSMFVAEMQELDSEEKLFQVVDHQQIHQQADQHLAKLLEPNQALITADTQKTYLRWLLDNFRWSPTALDAYLKDPEEFIHYNLLRVPRAKALPFSFGTAVHSALEKHYQALQQEGKLLSVDQLLKYFEQALSQEILTKNEFEDRLKFGKEILSQYHQYYQGDKAQPLLIERFFGSGKQKVVLDDILLTGRIDRIDWLNQKAKTVKVVDYKTGRAKSANEIEGKTASTKLSEREQQLPDSIKGSYKRQLLFYKLLTVLDKTFPYEVVEGEFDFIQPSDSGSFFRRNFSLVKEDVTDLKNLIKEVVSELRQQCS